MVLVPSSLEEEREGITRIIEALECNQWRTMVMKRKADPPPASRTPQSTPQDQPFESKVDDIGAAMDEVKHYSTIHYVLSSAYSML